MLRLENWHKWVAGKRFLVKVYQARCPLAFQFHNESRLPTNAGRGGDRWYSANGLTINSISSVIRK